MFYQRISTTADSFVAKSFRRAEFFNHSVVIIPKQYPDTFLLLRQRGIPEPKLKTGLFYQINLYSSNLTGFPDELFTDRKLNWHNQQLGERGFIAAAGLYVSDSALTITVMQSDLCQQLYRQSELKRICKTQVEKRFGAWHRMLFNAILDFAVENRLTAVYSPTADWILASTQKQVQPNLFRRIYDSVVTPYSHRRVARKCAPYWEISIIDNADRIVRLQPIVSPEPEPDQRPLICVFHDIEENVDTDVSLSECRDNLGEMLRIEKSCNIQATYNILGTRFLAKRQEIENCDSGHSLAFHSFNHDLHDLTQLTRCRQMDLQVRGYRPPQSVITAELTDYRLSYFNFEWLASGERSLGFSNCSLENGLVKIPIFIDDYPLFTGQQLFAEWEGTLLERVCSRSFVAFGLHDCYGRMWLDTYGKLLEKLRSIGTFVTADEVCDRVYRQHAVPCMLANKTESAPTGVHGVQAAQVAESVVAQHDNRKTWHN